MPCPSASPSASALRVPWCRASPSSASASPLASATSAACQDANSVRRRDGHEPERDGREKWKGDDMRGGKKREMK